MDAHQRAGSTVNLHMDGRHGIERLQHVGVDFTFWRYGGQKRFVQVRVTCTNGGAASGAYQIEVLEALLCVGKPQLAAVSIAVGDRATLTYEHDYEASTGGGRPLTYWWWSVDAGLSGSSSLPSITVTGVTEGSHFARIEVTCTNDAKAFVQYEVVVTPPLCAGSITGSTSVTVTTTSY